MAQIQVFHPSLTQFGLARLPHHSDRNEMSYQSLFHQKTDRDSLDFMEVTDEDLYQRKRTFEYVSCQGFSLEMIPCK